MESELEMDGDAVKSGVEEDLENALCDKRIVASRFGKDVMAEDLDLDIDLGIDKEVHNICGGAAAWPPLTSTDGKAVLGARPGPGLLGGAPVMERTTGGGRESQGRAKLKRGAGSKAGGGMLAAGRSSVEGSGRMKGAEGGGEAPILEGPVELPLGDNWPDSGARGWAKSGSGDRRRAGWRLCRPGDGRW